MIPLEAGQGSLSITVDFSAFNESLTAPGILIQYEKSDTGDTGSIESSISEKIASASASMNVGYYLLYIKLADGGSVKYVWNPQAIRIAANKKLKYFLSANRIVLVEEPKSYSMAISTKLSILILKESKASDYL